MCIKPAVLGLALLCAAPSILHAQAADTAAARISSHTLRSLDKQYTSMEHTLDKQTASLLQRMQHKETKLQKNVKDSATAAHLFAQSQQHYQELQTKLQQASLSTTKDPLKEYIPGFDSLQTATAFLQKMGESPANINSARLQQLQDLDQHMQALQGKLQVANEVKSYISQRQAQLTASLGQLGGAGQLTAINKEVYYYKQRLADYRSMFNDPDKAKQALLSAVQNLPAFKSFMQHNSYLARLFPAPAGLGTPQALQALQIPSQVQRLINPNLPQSADGTAGAGTSGFSGGGMDMGGYAGQQVQQAQGELAQLKDKLIPPGGNGGTQNMPQGFQPNGQKTKSFLHRLQYGFNIQSSGNSNLLPATTDLGLSLGYKLSDNSVIGMGASYKMGLGVPFNHVVLSNEGLGLRSYVNLRLKGSIWVTGGYERNYFEAFSNLQNAFADIHSWQNSGLLGLMKTVGAGRKQTSFQLLWDFLSYNQIPKAPAFQFRIGWSFN